MKLRASLFALAMLALSATFAAEYDEAAIKRRIDEIKESDTSGWRKIPWTESLLTARRAAEREKQSIFLFTYDGNLETGRC